MTRLILALIFCASIAAGQERTKLKWDQWQVVPIYQRFVDSIQAPTDAEVLKRLLNHQSVGVFLSLYTRYEAYCWADSTKHDRVTEGWEIYSAWSVSGDTMKTVTDTMRVGRWGAHSKYNTLAVYDSEPRFYMTHREPTFPGFIQWLRRNK